MYHVILEITGQMQVTHSITHPSSTIWCPMNLSCKKIWQLILYTQSIMQFNIMLHTNN